jgi:hypothetical protein
MWKRRDITAVDIAPGSDCPSSFCFHCSFSFFFIVVVIIIACLFIVFIIPSSYYLFDSRKGEKKWADIYDHLSVLFDILFFQYLSSCRIIILYLEMNFTLLLLLLLLTEIRDLQRRRKYGHGYQLSIKDRRHINDNWRNEPTHDTCHARDINEYFHQQVCDIFIKLNCLFKTFI